MNGNIPQSKSTRGSMICLGLALSFLELPTLAGIITGLAVYQSLKNGSNPGRDFIGFTQDVVKGFQSFVDSEKPILDFPVSALKGITESNFITLKKSGRTLSTDWIEEIAGKSNLGLLGDQGEGKSFLLRYILYQFLRSHDFNLSKCRVYIHDMENGLGHGEKSTWLGLNDSYVYSDPDDFVSILQDIERTIDRPDFIPTLLITDEFNNLLDELSKEQRETVDTVLKAIRNRGKKRKIHLVFSTQDINVSDLGLNQAIIRKMDWIIYPKMCQAANFRNFNLSTDCEAHRAKLTTELKSIDRVSGIFPVLLYRDKSFSLVRIPDLTGLPTELPTETELTPMDWWETFTRSHPEIDPNQYTSIRKLVDGVNDVLRGEGQPLINRKLSDPRYCLLRDLKDGVNASSNGVPRVTDNGLSQIHTPESYEPTPNFIESVAIPCDVVINPELLEKLK